MDADHKILLACLLIGTILLAALFGRGVAIGDRYTTTWGVLLIIYYVEAWWFAGFRIKRG